jgi:hypothetical protein
MPLRKKRVRVLFIGDMSRNISCGQWTPMNRSIEEIKPLGFRDFSDFTGKSLEVNSKSRWQKISRSPINLC